MTREPTDDRKPHRFGLRSIGLAALAVAFPVAFYEIIYLTTSYRYRVAGGYDVEFDSAVDARAFIPAAKIEAKLLGHRVFLFV